MKPKYDIDRIHNKIYIVFDDLEIFEEHLHFWLNSKKANVDTAIEPLGFFKNCKYEDCDKDYLASRYFIEVSYEKEELPKS